MRKARCKYCGSIVHYFEYYETKYCEGEFSFDDEDIDLESPNYEEMDCNDSEITHYNCPECGHSYGRSELNALYKIKDINNEDEKKNETDDDTNLEETSSPIHLDVDWSSF